MSDTLIAQLRSAIDRADQFYYRTDEHLPELTDAEYDALKAQLRQLRPDDERLSRVGLPYTADELRSKVQHAIPVGSLENTEGGISGIESWYNKISEDLGLDGVDLMASLKMDGATAVATYKDGDLVSVVTRGDGSVGEDVTTNAVNWQWLPTSLPVDASVIVRGEVMLYLDDFNQIMKEDNVPADKISNARNIGNGMIGRTDGRNNERLRFVAFNLVDAHGNRFELDMSERFEMLEAFGFQVVTHALLKNGEEEEVFSKAEGWCDRREEGRSELLFEIDGVVLSLNSNDLQQRMLHVSTNKLKPKHSRAVKFTSKKSTTKVIGCAITVGHTGALIPTAALEKVRVGGVHVQNALLNNWDEIARLDVAVGDEVEVELAGDIIPKVIRVINRPADRTEIGEPEVFQVDGTLYKTTRMHRGKEGAMTYLVGAGDAPELKRGKVKHYIGNSKKGVGILGVGDGVLDALVGGGLVETPADLYRLKEDQLVDMVIGTNRAGGDIRFGTSRAKALLVEIDKAKNLTLAKFLGSLGIDLLGRRKVDILAKQYQLFTLEDWRNEEKLLGMKEGTTRDAVINGMRKNSDLIDELLAVGVKVEGMVVVEKAAVDSLNESDPDRFIGDGEEATAGIFTGKAFCFTGTRELLEDVEAAGGAIKSGVSKNCHYLVQKDATSRTNKTKKAEELGMEIIGVDYLRKVLAGEAEL